MTVSRRNLTTRRGTITTFNFTDYHSVTLSEDVPKSSTTAPTTTLRVIGISREIELGKVLEFKDNSKNCSVIRFKTAGITPVGAETIAIEPYIGPRVPCELTAKTYPIDLTGRVYRAGVKKRLEDPNTFLPLPCTLQPLAGTISVVCDLRTLPFEDCNCNYVELPPEDELQTIDEIDKKTGKYVNLIYKKVIEKSYFWDLEYTSNGQGPYPDSQGRFWIEREATV